MTQPLFRPEVMAKQQNRLAGEVLITTPIAWHVLGCLIFSFLVGTLFFLYNGSYSRVQSVTGVLVPADGVSAVIPREVGVIAKVLVREGQMVTAGTPLITIKTDASTSSGKPVGAQIADAIAERQKNLADQVEVASYSAASERGQLQAQRSGLRAEIEAIESQIKLQGSLVDSSRKDLEQAQALTERGFISKRDIQTREDILLSREQSMLKMQQEISSKMSALSQTDFELQNIAARERSEIAQLKSARAAVSQESINAAVARGYVLRAPISGKVTGIIARVGQATANKSLLMIVPTKSQLQAELAIPVSAIAFVAPGQSVNVAVDAFPFQRFGTVVGQIKTVSSSAIEDPDKSTMGPFYQAIVALRNTKIRAYDGEQSLLPGMTISAKIVTERQSLLKWVLDPLFAAGQL